MEKLDIGILRELMIDENTLFFQADVRRPYRDIALKLNVSEDTIRNRVRKLEATGLIHGWKLGLNPSIFGYETAMAWIDVNAPSVKEDVIRAVRKLPRVIGIQNYFDNQLGISMACATQRDFDDEILRLKKLANSRNSTSTKTPFAPCNLKLTKTDWDIIKSLRKNPRKPYGKIGEELRVSRRTVKRRVEKLKIGGALFMLPELDLRRLEGGILASFTAFYPPESKSAIDRQIVSKYGELLFVTGSYSKDRGWFGFIVANPGAAKEIQRWIEGVEGVKVVYMRVIEEFINLLGSTFQDELETTPGKQSRDVGHAHGGSGGGHNTFTSPAINGAD